LNFKCSMV